MTKLKFLLLMGLLIIYNAAISQTPDPNKILAPLYIKYYPLISTPDSILTTDGAGIVSRTPKSFFDQQLSLTGTTLSLSDGGSVSLSSISGSSSFADITGAARDNTNLAAQLDLKADDDVVVKTGPTSPTQNIDVWMGTKAQFASASPVNDVIFITDSIPAPDPLLSNIYVDPTTHVASYYKNFVIPEGVTSIDDSGFQGLAISNLTLPSTLKYIGVSSFRDNNLKTITLPNSIDSIGQYAFLTNLLTSVNLGTGIKKIGFDAFGNNKITSVTLPSSLTYIDKLAFNGNKLTSIVIPNSVTHIGDYAFQNNELTSITFPTGITFIPTYCFKDNKLTSLVIPNTVTSIEDSAFYQNELTSITIPSSVTNIGASAFLLNNLTSVSLPSGITVDSNAFDVGVTITYY